MHTSRKEMPCKYPMPLNPECSDAEEETDVKKWNEAEDEIEDRDSNIQKQKELEKQKS